MNFLGGTFDPWVKAVVESHLDKSTTSPLTLDQASYLRTRHTGRLLHEHMSSSSKSPFSNPRKLIMNGRNHDHLGFSRQQTVQARTRFRTVAPGETVSRTLVHVVTRDQFVIWRESRRTLCPNQAASDDRHPQRAHEYSLA
jgi:hypothetical protein